MILDHLASADRYTSLHSGFAGAFAFLRRPDLASLEVGTYPIDGEQIYAMVQKMAGRSRDQAVLEAHRRYIDIQFVVAGVDEMGWKSLALCTEARADYSPEQDVQLFDDIAAAWTAVGPGAFTIFFPEDAHAPVISDGELHKVVIKVSCTGT